MFTVSIPCRQIGIDEPTFQKKAIHWTVGMTIEVTCQDDRIVCFLKLRDSLKKKFSSFLARFSMQMIEMSIHMKKLFSTICDPEVCPICRSDTGRVPASRRPFRRLTQPETACIDSPQP